MVDALVIEAKSKLQREMGGGWEHFSPADLGVWSLDSTSPLRQAFKDDKDNYYTMEDR